MAFPIILKNFQFHLVFKITEANNKKLNVLTRVREIMRERARDNQRDEEIE